MENTTIIQKLQAKKNKKGFTLVELVIVIAILAILAAIAIPVIVSTINSANTSTFESDKATMEMLVKAAINENKAGVHTKYKSATAGANDIDVTSGNLTIADIAAENGFNGNLKKDIGGTVYVMEWKNNSLVVTPANEATTAISAGTTISNATGATTDGLLTSTLKAGTAVVDINKPETPTT